MINSNFQFKENKFIFEVYFVLMKVGASHEVKQQLQELQARVQNWRRLNMNDFNANEVVVIFIKLYILHCKKASQVVFQ